MLRDPPHYPSVSAWVAAGRTLPNLEYELRSIVAAGQEHEVDRRNAILALGLFQCRAAVPELLVVMRHGNSDLRLYAVVALGRIGDERAVPALVDALQASSQPVRVVACRALALLGTEAALFHLLEHVGDEDERVRNAAQKAVHLWFFVRQSWLMGS